MASERPVGIATKENAIAIFEGALAKLKIGWCAFYDHREKSALESNPIPYGRGTWIDMPGTESWSCTGALGATGRELKLYYQQGCYALMDLIDQELFITKVRLRLNLNNNHESKDQEEAVLIFTETLNRMRGESHSQSAAAQNESEKANERNEDSKEASADDSQRLSQQG